MLTKHKCLTSVEVLIPIRIFSLNYRCKPQHLHLRVDYQIFKPIKVYVSTIHNNSENVIHTLLPHIRGTHKVTKSGDHLSSVMMESTIFVTSYTCVNYQKNNTREGSHFVLFMVIKLWKFLSSFLSLIRFEEYPSDEREKGMHVQIGGKENKKTLRATSHTRMKALWPSHYKISHWSKRQRPSNFTSH